MPVTAVHRSALYRRSGRALTEITWAKGCKPSSWPLPLSSDAVDGRFFGDGVLSEAAFAQAEAAASTVLAQAATLFPIGGWIVPMPRRAPPRRHDVLAATATVPAPLPAQRCTGCVRNCCAAAISGSWPARFAADKAPVVAGG